MQKGHGLSNNAAGDPKIQWLKAVGDYKLHSRFSQEGSDEKLCQGCHSPPLCCKDPLVHSCCGWLPLQSCGPLLRRHSEEKYEQDKHGPHYCTILRGLQLTSVLQCLSKFPSFHLSLLQVLVAGVIK